MNYFLPDALGSVRNLTAEDGAITLTRSYDPYGNLLSSTGSGITSFGFSGEWTDQTGFQNLRARYYLPNMGRFITSDTWKGEILRPASLNHYAYVNNNPINYNDPSGHIVCGTDEKPCPELPKWNYGEVLESYAAQAMDVIAASACFFVGCNVNIEEHSVEMGYGLPGPMPGVVIINPAFSPALMAGEEDIVYRVMRPDQHPSALEWGIIAKNIHADVAPQYHVRNGSRVATNWISTSRDLDNALRHQTNTPIYAINLCRVKSTIIDTTIPGVIDGWSPVAQNFAKDAMEVLIDRFIPPEAIRGIIYPPK